MKSISNFTLWPITGDLPTNLTKSSNISIKLGLPQTILVLIPVRSSINEGIGFPGFNKNEKVSCSVPFINLTAETSIINSSLGERPVVSRSIATNSLSLHLSKKGLMSKIKTLQTFS